MNTSQPLISIHDLSAGYGEEAILQNVNLEVYPRDFIGLIGPNGGGKSTLLKVILGCIAPTRGQVRVMGQSPQRGRTAIGYVPQFVEVDRAFPISVWDTVRMGLTTGWRLFSRLTRAEAGRIEAALAAVGLLDLRRRSMGELSGGQRQRAFIARALVADPEVLLLDEPTASIDPGVTSEIYDLLGRLNQNLAILLVSHDMLAITSYTKTIACLNRRLVYHQSKEITPEMLDTTYGCPVELVAHGVPHRVLAQHEAQQHG